MRLNAMILAAAICLSFFAPINLHLMGSPDGKIKYFASLAVCDASGPAALAKGDIPSIHEAACFAVPLESDGATVEADCPSAVLSLFSVSLERPPQS